MKLGIEAKRRLWAVGALAAFMLLSLAVAYLIPSTEERCVKQCAMDGKHGTMVNIFPMSMTGAREGPKECKCQ